MNYKLPIFSVGSIGWFITDILMGGIDAPLMALAVLMIFDIFTGMAASLYLGTMWSLVGFKGLVRKTTIIVAIILASVLDNATGLHMFRGMLISGWGLLEAVSIIENLDKMGLGYLIPSFLKDKLQQVVSDKHLELKDKP